jgi:hypothetical protein
MSHSRARETLTGARRCRRAPAVPHVPKHRRPSLELCRALLHLLAKEIGRGCPQSTGTYLLLRARPPANGSTPALRTSSGRAVFTNRLRVSYPSSWCPRYSLSPSGLSPPRAPPPTDARPRRRPRSGDLQVATPPPFDSSWSCASNAMSRVSRDAL